MQLVGREAVVQLDHVDVLGTEAGLLVGRRRAASFVMSKPTILISGRSSKVDAHVGHHRLPDDLDGPVVEAVLVDEALARRRSRRPTPSEVGRALQLGERLVDHLRGHDLVERVVVLELRVRVVHRVPVVLPPIRAKWSALGAVLLHVLAAGVAEHLGGGRRLLEARASRSSPSTCLSIGFARSVYLTPSEPFSIFSKPSASAQSASPPSTAWRAMIQRASSRSSSCC